MINKTQNSPTLALDSTDFPPALALIEHGHTVQIVIHPSLKQNQTEQKKGLQLHFINIKRPDILLELKNVSTFQFGLKSYFSDLRHRHKLASTLEQLIETVDSLADTIFFNNKKHPQFPSNLNLCSES